MNLKPKILYVDDEQINLQLFEINFSKNYDVIIAESGIKGLEILDSNSGILAVVSDMKMPYMNGIEFIKNAKVKFPSIKFYILTGFDITTEIQDALNSKLIIKYLRKPYNKNDIEIVLNEAIR